MVNVKIRVVESYVEANVVRNELNVEYDSQWRERVQMLVNTNTHRHVHAHTYTTTHTHKHTHVNAHTQTH
jgi:hypothetical protein